LTRWGASECGASVLEKGTIVQKRVEADIFEEVGKDLETLQ
jgi:hypothetical protein